MKRLVASRAGLIAAFVVPTAALSGAIAIGLAAMGASWTSPLGRAASVLHFFAVLIVTLVLQGPVLKQPVLEPLGLVLTPNRWWVVAWLLPVAALAVALAVAKLAFGADVVLTASDAARYIDAGAEDPPHPLMLILMALPAGITFNLLRALVAEVGFRGLLFREMPGSFWPRALAIGVIHGAWLGVIGPLLVGEEGLGAHALAAVFGLVASPALVALRARSGSVVASSAFLGTVFALGRVGHDLARGIPPWQAPFFGVSGIAGIAVIVAALYAHDRWLAKTKLMSG
jgi:hypothetical protein